MVRAMTTSHALARFLPASSSRATLLHFRWIPFRPRTDVSVLARNANLKNFICC
jgi:hypothetical protein